MLTLSFLLQKLNHFNLIVQILSNSELTFCIQDKDERQRKEIIQIHHLRK